MSELIKEEELKARKKAKAQKRISGLLIVIDIILFAIVAFELILLIKSLAG